MFVPDGETLPTSRYCISPTGSKQEQSDTQEVIYKSEYIKQLLAV